MSGYPIPDGGIWTGDVDGREWEATGDLERFEYVPEDLVWKLEYAPVAATLGTWGAWVDYSDRLESFSVSRQVVDWYKGPRAATGSIVLSNEDGDHGGDIGGLVRITVTVPSGDHVIFYGLVADKQHIVNAVGYARIGLSLTDWYGFQAQQIVNNTIGSSNTSGFHLIYGPLGSYSIGNYVAGFVAKLTAIGALQTIPTGNYNFADYINKLMRGCLGMLWVNREGDWDAEMYQWWTPTGDAVAAIGSDTGTPIDDYTYRFPYSKATHGVGLTDLANDISLTTAAPSSPHTATDINSGLTYGVRYLSDTAWSDNDAEVAVHASTLLAKLKDERYSYRTITYPADLSADAMEYSARAEITDYINVALESREGDWQAWHAAHVMGVSHSWSPASGWNVTLQATRDLI